MTHALRPRMADESDLGYLPGIEAEADRMFSVAEIEIFPPPGTTQALRDASQVIVVGRPPVGFARLEELDGAAHLEQLSVRPDVLRQGIGSALVEACVDWARRRHRPAITVITFADVEWNGPFYARLGFVEIDDLTPGLRELRDWEQDIGMDRIGRRIVMRRDVD